MTLNSDGKPLEAESRCASGCASCLASGPYCFLFIEFAGGFFMAGLVGFFFHVNGVERHKSFIQLCAAPAQTCLIVSVPCFTQVPLLQDSGVHHPTVDSKS